MFLYLINTSILNTDLLINNFLISYMALTISTIFIYYFMSIIFFIAKIKRSELKLRNGINKQIFIKYLLLIFVILNILHFLSYLPFYGDIYSGSYSYHIFLSIREFFNFRTYPKVVKSDVVLFRVFLLYFILMTVIMLSTFKTISYKIHAFNILYVIFFIYFFYIGNMNSQLVMAVRYGDIRNIKYLIEQKGASVNSRSSDGRSILQWAIWNENDTIVKYLIDKGANINIRSISWDSAINQASNYGRLDYVEYIKKYRN